MFGKVSDFTIKQFEKGDVILKEGQAVESLIIVKSGEIACVTLRHDRLVPVGMMKGAGVLAEDAVFSENSPSSYSAVAMTNVSVMEIPKKDIISVLDAGSAWLKKILFDMSDKINKTTDALADHRIIDDRFNGGKPFTAEEESLIKSSLKEKKSD